MLAQTVNSFDLNVNSTDNISVNSITLTPTDSSPSSPVFFLNNNNNNSGNAVDGSSQTPQIVIPTAITSTPLDFNLNLNTNNVQPIAPMSALGFMWRSVDVKKDVAHLGKGRTAYRVHAEPRLMEWKREGPKPRPRGWNLFHETRQTRLTKQPYGGYRYRVPLGDGFIGVRAGLMEMSNQQKLAPQSGTFEQTRDGDETVTRLSDVYPGIDVEFRDRGWRRSRALTIKQTLDGLTKEGRVVLWEEYLLSKGSVVLNEERQEIIGEVEIADASVWVKAPTGQVFAIGSAHRYDARGKEETWQSVRQIVRVEPETMRLLIGLILPGSYLTNPETAYPVTIDPSYALCYDGSYPDATTLSCSSSLVTLVKTGGRSDGTEWLSVGYNQLSPIDWSSSIPLIKFNSDFTQFDGSTVESATLRLRAIAPSTGSYTGCVPLETWKVDAGWNSGNVTFGALQNSLTKAGDGTQSICYTSNSLDWYRNNPQWYAGDVKYAVQSWVNGGTNQGILIQESPRWTSSQSSPAWYDRLFSLAGSAYDYYSGAWNPHLIITLAGTPNQNRPDLVSASQSVDRTTARPGETVTVTLSVRNGGAAAMDRASSVDYYFKKDAESYDAMDRKGTTNVPILGVGAAAQQIFAYTVPVDAANGAYYFSYAIDPGNVIAEADESNNRGSFAIHVEGAGGPDPLADNDGDGYKNIEEQIAGTNVNGPQSVNLYDTSFWRRLRIRADEWWKSFTADPVNARTGAFELEQTDFTLPGRGFPIEFKRTYSSKISDRNARLGAGWTHSYSMYYYQDPSTKNVQIYLGGVLTTMFTTGDGGLSFAPRQGEFDELRLENTTLVYRTLDDGRRYEFSRKLTNNMGLLERIIDPTGNATEFGYVPLGVDDLSVLTSITDPSGREITISYWGDGPNWDKIQTLTERFAPGVERPLAEYYYSDVGRLTTVRQYRYYQNTAEAIEHEFSYNSAGRMTYYRDPRGAILRNQYDSDGRVIRQREQNPRIDGGSGSRIIYDLSYEGPDGRVPGSAACTLTYSFKTESIFNLDTMCFNADALKAGEINIYSDKNLWEYNSQGMVSKLTDAGGNVTQYEYDGRRRLTREILPDISGWHTEIAYEYENIFSRLTKKTTTATPLPSGEPTVKIERYDINPANGTVASATDAVGFQEFFTYDSMGNVLTHTDKNGGVVSYQYDPLGNYVMSESVNATKPDGSLETVRHDYTYDAYGNRTSHTTPRRHLYQYQYDTRGNLRKENFPDGNFRRYEYDTEGHRVALTDERGKMTAFVYDTDINASLLSETRAGLPSDIARRYEYDWLGNKAKEIDALENETRFVYDMANRLSQKIDPYNTLTYQYDPNSRVKFETNSLGQKTEYAYDARGNTIQTKRYLNDSDFILTVKTYDGLNRIVAETDGRGNTASYIYDKMDRRLSITDSLNNVTNYYYDDQGNLTGALYPRAQSDSSLRNTFGKSVTYVYNEINQKIKEINADNKQTWTFYDRNGNIEKIIDRQNGDGTGNSRVIEFGYDPRDRKTSETDTYLNANRYYYDPAGNMASSTDRSGRTTGYVYDDFNRLTRETDAAGNLTKYEYDKNGNRTAVVYPDTTRTEYVYDATNRLTQINDQLGNKRKFGYDTVGNKKYEVDKTNATTTFDYDRLNRLTGELNAAGTITAYVYDANGNRTSETAAGIITLFEYNKLNRLATTTHPGNKTESFIYDAEGNVASKTDGKSQTIIYQYDKLNRLTLKDLPTGVDAVYAYDNWNNLLTLTDESGATNYTYDNNNRLINEHKVLTGAGTYDIGRTYHFDGQLKTITDAAGRTVSYNYDNRGLLQTTVYGATTLATYAYTSFGKPYTLTYGNGVVSTYNYDGLERLTKLETKNSASEILFKQEYLYDGESNRTAMIENGVTTTYNYDNLHQLTGVDYPQFAGADNLDYDYSLSGNRTSYNTPYGQVAYSYTPNTNELSQAVYDSRLSVNYTYDNNGSLTKETYDRLNKNIREVVYGWDVQNRLASIQYNRLDRPSYLPALSQNKISFVYDDFGNRTKKSMINDQGSTTYYINDGLSVLNELDASGNVTKTMVRGLEPIAEIDGTGTITYVHNDVLGSAILLTDSSGAVKGQYEYEPFGDIVGLLAQGEGTDYLFTGQEYDIESSLYYYNARYYNPKLGRFISRDMFMGRDGDLLSRNRYIYVKNNPLKYVDPSGEEEKRLWKDDIGDLIRSLLGIETANAASFSSIRGTAGSIWAAMRDRIYKVLGIKVNSPPSLNVQPGIVMQPVVNPNLQLAPTASQAESPTKTWDPVTDKRILMIDERLRGPAAQFINKVEADLQIKLRVTQALRTIDEQNTLYASGRTVPGPVRTNAKGGESYHNYGLAFDVVPIEDNKSNYNTDKWEQIGVIGEGFSFEWGGRWKKFVDKPHFQMTFGKSPAELYKEYLKSKNR
ncbi:MAG: RHS repeat-associated core domain-containing protein [Patescibacteria group bacterium]